MKSVFFELVASTGYTSYESGMLASPSKSLLDVGYPAMSNYAMKRKIICNYADTLFEPPAEAGEERKRGHPAPGKGTASPCTPYCIVAII